MQDCDASDGVVTTNTVTTNTATRTGSLRYMAAPNYSAWQSLKHDNLQDCGRFGTIPKLPEGRTASPPLADSRRVADASRRARARSDDGAHIAMTRAFWRREPDATLRQAPKSHTRSFNSMGMSALLRTTDSTRTSRHVRDVPILLQKSFWGVERKFLEPLVRFARGDVRDHIG